MTFLNTFWPIMVATLAVIVLSGLGLSLGMLFGRPPPRWAGEWRLCLCERRETFTMSACIQ